MTNPTLFALALLAAVTVPGQGSRAVPLEAADCSRFQSSFGTTHVGHAVRQERVPMGAGTLDIRPDGNGGVTIQAGTGDSYAITACVTAGGGSPEEAQRVAESVTLRIAGNRVRASAPENTRNWNVQLIVEAPRGAQIDVETHNGPIGIRGVEGSITARASNGPIGLTDVSASVRAVAKNGPITIRGGRGNLDVETQNGPITVEFQGNRWEGEINGRAKNGPLSVRVPDGFDSVLEVTSSRRSPWNCRIAGCTEASSDDDGVRTLKVGNGTPTVRLSTENGPVSVDRTR